MKLRLPFLAVVVLVGAAISVQTASCSSSDDAAPTPLEAGPVVPPTDGGGDGAFVPADHPAFPQLVYNGGPVLKTPTLVAITFANDPHRAELDTFTETIGKTQAYWKAIADDYGVGPAAGRSVHLAGNAPATISDTQIRAALTANLTGPTPGYGALDSQAVYTFFIPAGTAGAKGPADAGYPDSDMAAGLCSEAYGYHDSMLVNGQPVVYAIVALCPPALYASFGITKAIDALTAVTTHEWFEAVSDPFSHLPGSKAGFYGLDELHSTWSVVRDHSQAGENGDLCHEAADHIDLVLPNITYKVQRIWSNQEAKLGRHYCAPANGATAFNSVPVLPDRIPFTFGGKTLMVEGVTIPVGTSKTVELKLFSSAPTEAWTVEAVDSLSYDAVTGGGYTAVPGGVSLDGGPVIPPRLTFALDKPSGVNGDVIKMTITAVKNDGRYGKATPFIVGSKLGKETRYYIGAVGN